MTTRHVLGAVVVGLGLAPVVLVVGGFFLVPVALLMISLVVILAIVGLPALLVSAARRAEPATARTHATASRVAYSSR